MESGQYDNAHTWTVNSETGYNLNKTDKDHNGNARDRNDKKNAGNDVPNTLNYNGGNERHQNELIHNSLGYGTSQYEELSSRLSGMQQADRIADRTQQSSLNDQNMLHQGLNYERNDLPSSAISVSFGSHVGSLFRQDEARDGSYQSGTVHSKIETRHGINQTLHTDKSSNEIDEKDEEDMNECSDQEFR